MKNIPNSGMLIINQSVQIQKFYILQNLLPPERVTCDWLLQLSPQSCGDQPVHARRQPPQCVASRHRVGHSANQRLFKITLIINCRLVVDTAKAIQFAIDIAKGMAFIHSLDRQLPRLYLSSKHVMVKTCMSQIIKRSYSIFTDRLRFWWRARCKGKHGRCKIQLSRKGENVSPGMDCPRGINE